MALTDKLRNIAEAIRFKTGKSAPLTLAEMPDEIMSISGGGSSDIPFPFGGLNAELIAEYDEDYNLADTSFVIGESASTTATSIKASVSNRYTNTTGSPTYNYGDKDIIVVQAVNCNVEHETRATDVSRQLKSSYVMTSYISKRKTSDTSAKTTRQVLSIANANAVKYYNASGTVSRTVLTSSYGFYGTPQAPTMASTTATSTYVRVSSPALYYRVSGTYESANNIKLVKDVQWHWNVKVYVVDPFSTPVSAVNDEQDAFLTDADSRMMGRMMPMMDDVTDEVDEPTEE